MIIEGSSSERPEEIFDALWSRSLDSGDAQPESFWGRLYHALNFPSRIFSKQRLLLKVLENEIAATQGRFAGLRILWSQAQERVSFLLGYHDTEQTCIC